MEIDAVQNRPSQPQTRSGKKKITNSKPPFLEPLLDNLFIKTNIWSAVTNINLLVIYFLIAAAIAGYHISFWYIMVYILSLYALNAWRNAKIEKDRLQIAHRIPFFADALANSLSVGGTLEQAFVHASYYLKGKIKIAFNELVLKSTLGNDLGVLLLQLDAKFPRTGLRYLISLLKEYRELGIGISPLLKKVARALTEKADAEEKIATILSAGSSYARLSIIVFLGIFASMTYLLRDQISLLLSPDLKPAFLFLVIWTFVGILIVIRITSIRFTRTFALKSYIKPFLVNKKFTMDEFLHYSGLEWTPGMRKIILYSPLFVGLLISYMSSWYNANPYFILLAFGLGAMIYWLFLRYVLKGLVEDQLIETIEIFPEILQVFTIGLNSSLNIYQSFQLAQDALKGVAPKILSAELCRTMFAMECGEEHSKTWQRLAKVLPFETIVDFCEIMVVAPMHGQSIVYSIAQMMNSYQSKKLILIEKKATTLSQLVFPIIVLAFFPLFLFSVFAPLIIKISGMLGT